MHMNNFYHIVKYVNYRTNFDHFQFGYELGHLKNYTAIISKLHVYY